MQKLDFPGFWSSGLEWNRGEKSLIYVKCFSAVIHFLCTTRDLISQNPPPPKKMF